jgi:hypothetical protein
LLDPSRLLLLVLVVAAGSCSPSRASALSNLLLVRAQRARR